MVTAHRLRAAPLAACTRYYAIGAPVIHRVVVTAVTAASPAGFTWSGAHVVVVGGCLVVLGAMQQVNVRI